METQTAGIWLIGLGALVIVLALVIGSERPYEGMTFRGPLSTGSARLRFALEATGAAFVAAGSVLLALTEPPPVWIALALPIGYGLVHGLAAWKVKQYWEYRREEAVRAAPSPDATRLQQQMAACAVTCAGWRWSLRHPYNSETWPKSAMVDPVSPTVPRTAEN